MNLLRKVVGIVFYAVSALFMVYTVWAFSRSSDVISEAIEFGQITVSENLYEIVNFYMANAGSYFVFALLLAGMGILLYKGEKKPVQQSASDDIDPATAQNDAELDEWFSEHENKKTSEP